MEGARIKVTVPTAQSDPELTREPDFTNLLQVTVVGIVNPGRRR
ncbi:MAG TPA: hypothetical protein V6C72_00120 [Chroococcales cyanobacterium]